MILSPWPFTINWTILSALVLRNSFNDSVCLAWSFATHSAILSSLVLHIHSSVVCQLDYHLFCGHLMREQSTSSTNMAVRPVLFYKELTCLLKTTLKNFLRCAKHFASRDTTTIVLVSNEGHLMPLMDNISPRPHAMISPLIKQNKLKILFHHKLYEHV